MSSLGIHTFYTPECFCYVDSIIYYNVMENTIKTERIIAFKKLIVYNIILT